LKGVEKAQKASAEKGGYRIDTTKSKQNIDTDNRKNATTLKDAEEHHNQ